MDESGRLSSPQVPTSNHRDLAESTVLSGETIRGCNIVLERIESLIDVEAIRKAQVIEEEQRLAMTPASLAPAAAGSPAAGDLWRPPEVPDRVDDDRGRPSCMAQNNAERFEAPS
ncbi:MAG: hypothetical protein M5U08_14105, partial [Burkholderiales bacterium]|nr:hypothetical protein [Burkholderiales bacterium]